MIRIVLVGTRNPLNIGAAARALSNFGFTDLVLVQPYDASWREAKSAMGGKGLLATARVLDTVQAAVAGCALVVGTASVGSRLLKLPVRRLEYGARLIRKDPGPVALLFGSEKTGLSNDDLSLCHWLLRIPTRNEQLVLKQNLDGQLAKYRGDVKAAKEAITVGASKPRADLDASEVAAYTLVANLLLNLDETLSKN